MRGKGLAFSPTDCRSRYTLPLRNIRKPHAFGAIYCIKSTAPQPPLRSQNDEADEEYVGSCITLNFTNNKQRSA
jgi:hypothetical protein